MKDFFQYRDSLTEARKSNTTKKKEIKKGWSSEPKKSNSSIVRLFNKMINPEKKTEQGYMTNGIYDLISFYAKEAIEDGDFEDYVDPYDVPKKYVEDGEIDFWELEKNPRDWKRFLSDFEDMFSNQQWKNVQNDLRSSKSNAVSINSKNTSKPLKITVAEGGGYYSGSGSYEVYYIHVGNKVNFESPNLILMSDKSQEPKEIATTIERLMFDGHKSVKGIRF